jgi:thiamine pyrophosphokinase
MRSLRKENEESKLITAIVSGGTVDEAFASGFLDTLQPDRIIAADRGYYYLKKMGITPDHIVGDFDSLPQGECLPDDPAIEIRRFRPEKDDTDTGIAASLAAALGSDEVYFLGATGTRVDHLLANIALLSVLAEKGITGHIVDAHNKISLLTCSGEDREQPQPVRFTLERSRQFGKYVSFAPFGGPVVGLTLSGFKYPLQNRTIVPKETQLVVSNEIADDRAVVSFIRGSLLMTESRD